MNKLNNSDFYLVKDIINELGINAGDIYEKQQKNEELSNCWNEIIGEKISKMTKLYEISADNILTIICSDSYVANELFNNKEKIIEYMMEKANKLGINIKDIKFNYKKWKETDNA